MVAFGSRCIPPRKMIPKCAIQNVRKEGDSLEKRHLKLEVGVQGTNHLRRSPQAGLVFGKQSDFVLGQFVIDYGKRLCIPNKNGSSQPLKKNTTQLHFWGFPWYSSFVDCRVDGGGGVETRFDRAGCGAKNGRRVKIPPWQIRRNENNCDWVVATFEWAVLDCGASFHDNADQLLGHHHDLHHGLPFQEWLRLGLGQCQLPDHVLGDVHRHHELRPHLAVAGRPTAH